MDSSIKRMAATLVLAGFSASACAAQGGAFFANANVGQATYHDQGFSDRTDTSSALRVGYAWDSGDLAFGLEAGFVNLGKASDHAQAMDGSVANAEAKADGPLLGVNMKYPFRNKMFVAARAGWFRSSVDMRSSVVYANGQRYDASGSYSGDGSYVGASAGYDFTRHFSMGLAYDAYHGRVKVSGTTYGESIGVVSAFAEVRF